MKFKLLPYTAPKKPKRMKSAIRALFILAFAILPQGFASGQAVADRPERSPGMMTLLPADNEIPGWKSFDKLLQASSEAELYKILNGAASLYIRHGFRAFAGQSYRGPKGTELEVYIFDQGSVQNTLDLFENPFNKPAHGRDLKDVGETARLDESPLFSYGVEFIQKGFFVRVVVQDKSDEGLKAAVSFARSIAQRIQ